MAYRENVSRCLSDALNTKEDFVEVERTKYITELERQNDKISTLCAIVEAILASGSADSALIWISDVLMGDRYLPRRLLTDKTVISMVKKTSDISETDWMEALGDDRCLRKNLKLKPKKT